MTTKKNNAVRSYAVACDWLTIATYKFEKYCLMAAWVRGIDNNEWSPGKWLQYDGHTNGKDLFYGSALQSHGKEHYLLKISGGTAGALLWEILQEEWASHFYATRIDLQKTQLPNPDWWRPRDLYDYLDENGVASSIIQSTTSTVYVGNRACGRFCRLYEKELGELYLRLEIELKKAHSKRAWELLLAGASIRDLYSAHLYKLSLPQAIVSDYDPTNANELDISTAVRNATIESQMKWLESLVPKFQQMANDHDIGQRVRNIFYSLSLDLTGGNESEQ